MRVFCIGPYTQVKSLKNTKKSVNVSSVNVTQIGIKYSFAEKCILYSSTPCLPESHPRRYRGLDKPHTVRQSFPLGAESDKSLIQNGGRRIFLHIRESYTHKDFIISEVLKSAHEIPAQLLHFCYDRSRAGQNGNRESRNLVVWYS